MRKVSFCSFFLFQLSILMFLFLAIGANAQTMNVTRGPMSSFWLGTFSVGTHITGCSGSSMPDGENLGTYLGNALSTAIASKYPTTGFTWEHNFRNADVNLNNFWAVGQTNSDDLIYIAGHGAPGIIQLGDCNQIDLENGGGDRDNPYLWGGYTKWVILYSCRVLQHDPNTLNHNGNGKYYFQDMFRGVHTILGFVSSIPSFTPNNCKKRVLWWCSQYYKSNQDLYKDFVSRWVTSGAEIRQAWANSVLAVCQDWNYGVSIRVTGVDGWILENNQKVNFVGSHEKYASVLQYPTPMTTYQTQYTMRYWVPRIGNYCTQSSTYTWGTPSY